MEETSTPYKQLSSQGKDVKNQLKTYLTSPKKTLHNTTVFNNEQPFELQHFEEGQQNNTDYTSLSNGLKSHLFKNKYAVSRRTMAAFISVTVLICMLLISVVYIWKLQQKSNNSILEDITSLKENLKRDNKKIMTNITNLKRRVNKDNWETANEMTKLKGNIYRENANIMKEVRNIKRNLKQDIRGLARDIVAMGKAQKKDYCYGKNICSPYSTCYGTNCTCNPILPRDQKYCHKSQCWPSKITSAYSNTKDGRTYMTVGPLMYQFKHRYPGEPFASVAATWPRSSYEVWKAFERIDEIFIHNDRNTYIFSGDEYMVHLYTNNNTKGLLPVKKIGDGIDEQGRRYIGWPGLKHSKYINAALHDYGDETYIFQDDLVYMWNSSIESQNEDHYPKGAVEAGWPKKISEVFPGLPDDLDTAFLYYYDRKLYFIKGLYFYTWDKVKRKTKGPHLTKDYWRYLCDTYVCSTKLCTPSKR